MNIIIYNDEDHTTIQAIETIGLMFKECRVIRVMDHNMFKKRLATCLAGESVIIFFINKEENMRFLESMAKYFVDIKLLIYLTRDNNRLASRAYDLAPRIVISNDSSKELLPAVLERILKQFKQ